MMKIFILLLFIFSLGCVNSEDTSMFIVPRAPNGYATATWEDSNSNYFMLFFGDVNVGICLDTYADHNRFKYDANVLRDAYLDGNKLTLSLRPPTPCGVWNRPLYWREIVTYHVKE